MPYNVWCTSFQEPPIESHQSHHANTWTRIPARLFCLLSVLLVSSFHTSSLFIFFSLNHVKNSTSACTPSHIGILPKLAKKLFEKKNLWHTNVQPTQTDILQAVREGPVWMATRRYGGHFIRPRLSRDCRHRGWQDHAFHDASPDQIHLRMSRLHSCPSPELERCHSSLLQCLRNVLRPLRRIHRCRLLEMVVVSQVTGDFCLFCV